jgi:hypothetical protein
VTDAAPASAPGDLPARPNLHITPEPTTEEMAALTAALMAVLGDEPSEAALPPAQVPAWRIAALREGVSGITGGPRTGWGKPRGGWRG